MKASFEQVQVPRGPEQIIQFIKRDGYSAEVGARYCRAIEQAAKLNGFSGDEADYGEAARRLEDESRVLQNLKWLKENQLPAGVVWSAWKQDVESEAIKLGLVSGVQVGCNCPSVNCPEPVYGGDMAEVF